MTTIISFKAAKRDEYILRFSCERCGALPNTYCRTVNLCGEQHPTAFHSKRVIAGFALARREYLAAVAKETAPRMYQVSANY